MGISINRLVARRLVLANIARNPTDAELDGAKVPARLGDISNSRKIQLAGVLDAAEGAELLVALEEGSPAPVSNKSVLYVGGVRYDIAEVQPMLGSDCYILTISKYV